jgi:Prokaryotic homologs of the JAB domain
VSAYRLAVTAPVLEAAREFFEDRGSHGWEGTGMLACRSDSSGWWVTDRFVAPDQQAQHVGSGRWVEVTDAGKRQLAIELQPGELFVARIHSHPGTAFHSDTDDRNPALTFNGALSIVVPYFGLGLRHGLDSCAVFRLDAGRWNQLGNDRALWVDDRTSVVGPNG